MKVLDFGAAGLEASARLVRLADGVFSFPDILLVA